MKYFIGYDSALEFWRSPIAPDRPQLSRALPSPSIRMRRADVEPIDFANIGINRRPIHLVVADPSCRTRSPQVIWHVMNEETLAESFVRVGGNTFVSSPASLFVQVAQNSSLADLVLLGHELCGTYAVDDSDPRGFRTRDALATVASLRRFIDKAKGVHGIKRARRALSFINEGSESPMESIQAMLLCLPCRLGGLGVDRGELNGIIDASVSGKPFAKGKSYRCDMVWRRHNLVVEYDSDRYHTGPDRIARDSKRRADLIAAGYTVVTVTGEQLFSAPELEKVADTLIRRMGKQVRKQSYNVLTRRYELRKALFSTIPLVEAKGSPGPVATPEANSPDSEAEAAIPDAPDGACGTAFGDRK